MMSAIFGHSGGIDGVTTSYGTRVEPGPSAFAHAQSMFTQGLPEPAPAVRRPTSLHLRGSLTRPEQQEGQEWSATATADPSPAANDAGQHVEGLGPSTPTQGVPLS